jgi:hypothetical protein
MHRPKNLKRVMDFLHDIGLTVTGPKMDMRCGFELPGEQEYCAEQVITRDKLIKADRLVGLDD